MNLRETVSNMLRSFSLIFSGSVLSMYIFSLIFADDVISLHNITALLVMSVLADLAFFIFYSKKELSRGQMLFRHVVHMFTILGIMLSVAGFMGWISWNEPPQIIVFITLVMIVYLVVWSLSVYRTKILADKMTEKLKERYKG